MDNEQAKRNARKVIEAMRGGASAMDAAAEALREAAEQIPTAVGETGIKTTYAPGRVRITTTVNGKKVNITLTPAAAQAFALEIMTAVLQASKPGGG